MPNTKIPYFLVILWLPALPLAAQDPFYEEATQTHLPENLAGACMDASAGDADGDGDPDLILAMEFQTNVLLLNDGEGRFTDASENLPRNVHDSEDVAFADFDNDGDLDLIFVSEDDRTDELYLNEGDGNFSDASDRLPAGEVSNALAVMDLNGDGSADILIGNIGTDHALLNDGAGQFRVATEELWPQDEDDPSRTQDLELADVDGDGDQDVIVGNEGPNRLFLNEGGRLSDASAGRLPDIDDETREIRAFDADGDGDLDLAVANVSFLRQDQEPRDYLLINDGAGVFSRAPDAALAEDARSNFTIQAADLDGDGDMDLLAPSTVFAPRTFEFFVRTVTADGEERVTRTANLGINDFDDDGDLDVVYPSDAGEVFLYFEQGALQAADDSPEDESQTRREIDGDGDGEPELAVSTFPLGDFLAAASGTGPALVEDATLDFYDLGNDGRIDIIFPATMRMEAVGDYLVLLNDGAGNFAAAAPGAALPAAADGNGFDIEVADFNGDGIDDLFLCNRASLPGEQAALSGGRQRLLLGLPR